MPDQSMAYKASPGAEMRAKIWVFFLWLEIAHNFVGKKVTTAFIVFFGSSSYEARPAHVLGQQQAMLAQARGLGSY